MRSICFSLAAVAFAVIFSPGALAQPVLVTAVKTIGPLDTTITPTAGGPPIPLATAQITVQGTTLTINGRHAIDTLDLIGSAVVTHAAAFTFDYSGNGSDIVNGLHLTANAVSIDPSARIDVTALGYPTGTGPGAGQNSDGGSGNYAGGGGHGGNGQSVTTPGGGTYDDFLAPSDFGSGGGTFGATPGGAGGGAVRLVISGTLTVDGIIRANGGAAPNSVAGRGAGGTIRIAAASVAGSGIIEANGGAQSLGGGGGGGRISLAFNAMPFNGAIRAHASGGGTGSIYYAQDAQTPLLVLDNGGTNNRTELSSPLTLAGDLIIRGGVGLAHPHADSDGLVISVTGNATIEPSGTIDASERGFPAGSGPGAGTNSDGSSGQYAGGAGYGGNGQSVTTPGGGTYGSFEQPIALGSGGGNFGANLVNAGGAGGGRIRFIVGGTLTNDGIIRANGGAPPNSVAGRGSGGSLWITATTLAGSGIIEAIGGTPSNGGAGGGGRVAVEYASSSFLGAIRAYGHGGSGTGTVYLTNAGISTLIFDNGGTTNRTDYSQPITVNGHLIIRGGVGLGHAQGSASGLALTISGNALIEASGSIDATGRGHLGGSGPGAGINSDGSSGQYAGGAGYGGNGQSATTPGGPTYGSFEQPIALGSGGGNYGANPANAGGTGGGRVRLSIGGTLTVDGMIRADGGVPGNSVAGRGSGGSLWITTNALAGSGIIESKGGTPSNGGAGGGGRVAVEYASSSFLGAIRAFGHGGSGTGTVYLTNAGTSTLIFDNGGTTNRTDYSQPITVNGHLIVRGGVGLGHWLGNTNGLAISVSGNATVEAGGTIDVTGRGHPGGFGPGAGINSDGTSGQYAGGAGYGGNGQAVTTPGGPTYGSFAQPDQLGSGGGNYGTNPVNAGGPGGGFVGLDVGGVLTVDGIIRSNGALPANGNSVAGRGSGGSLWITTGSLAGSGIIEAIGGMPSNGGAGGGGRIAIASTSSSFVGAIRAFGHANSGTGTIYLTSNGTNTLIFDNGGTTNRTDYSQPITVNGNLIVRGGVGLGHPAGQLAGLPITVSGNATIETGGSIDASGRGYSGGFGPGAGGNSNGAGGQFTGGGGHGGTGQSVTTQGGFTYGSITKPDQLGSGGGNYGTNPVNAGGAGGGAVRLTVGGILTVDGLLRSNGALPPNGTSVAGRGAGGSLWITAGGVIGSGFIEADGGPPSNGGAGGGGRVAVYSCNFLMSPSQVHANRGGASAGDGTVHLATATAEVSPPAACLGETITFNVITVGNPGTLQWRLNGQPITDGPTPSGAIYAGTNTANLTITNASSAEGGEYDCEVSGSCGAAVTNAVSLLVTCCPDVNCDFALDGFDVETQERAVGGDMADYCQSDPDFNRDFALDGFDVEAVELTVGGGPCP